MMVMMMDGEDDTSWNDLQPPAVRRGHGFPPVDDARVFHVLNLYFCDLNTWDFWEASAGVILSLDGWGEMGQETDGYERGFSKLSMKI